MSDSPPQADKPDIQHVFVLMLENRSYDHVFAHREATAPTRINRGLDGAEYAQGPMPQPDARCFRHDPPHEADTVHVQLGGGAMDGFIRAFQQKQPGLAASSYARVMQYLAREDMPISNFLADHFVSARRWFAAVPTGTIPNRMYAMCGHSEGFRDNPTEWWRFLIGFDSRDSVFQKLEQKRVPWRIYSGTFPPWAALIRRLWDNMFEEHQLAPIKRLALDLKDAGPDFPKFVWLEPAYSWAEVPVVDAFYAEPNCDHPPSDVFRGQALISFVYEAIRKSPIWKRSALVVLYDEHGGFYDHMPPPACDPGKDGFRTRGPRVPALVISPFVRPDLELAQTDLTFDHCSVLKFVCEQHGIEPWTPRLRDPSTASLSAFFQPMPRLLEAPPPPAIPESEEMLRLDRMHEIEADRRVRAGTVADRVSELPKGPASPRTPSREGRLMNRLFGRLGKRRIERFRDSLL